MTARQLAEWKAWYEVEPRGEDLIKYAVAFLSTVILSCHAKECPNVGELLEAFTDLWTPLTGAEKARRKKRKQSKWKKPLTLWAKGLSHVNHVDRKAKRPSNS